MLTPNDSVVKKADTKSLRQAQFEDLRHRMHAEAATSAETVSPYFKTWINDYLTPTIPAKSAREQVIRQMGFPLSSVRLVDEIIDATLSVHHAQDRYISIEMTDDALQADAEGFLERRDLRGFIIKSCHNQLFSGPNALVVVDAPAVQTTAFPEPYCYILPTSKIEKAKPLTGPVESGLFDFAFFQTDKPKQYALFDQQEISVWQKGDASGYEQIGQPVAHNLPFAPVFKLWSDIEDNSPMVSNSVLRPNLGLLNRYVFWDAAKESNDLAAAFAILWFLENDDCDYRTADGISCQKGFIERPSPEENCEPIRSRCPVCEKKGLIAPGSKFGIPAPQKKEDADWRAPAGWISADVPNLKYIEDKVTKLANTILQTATGNQAGPQNEQALNEDQIFAILESSRRVGQYLAEYFEQLHKRLIESLLRFRYGSSYVGCTVNYGRRFVVLSGDQLHALYESSKKIGSSWLMEEINAMLQDYYARADASRSLRYKLLDDLNPYPYMSAADLVAAQINEMDPQGYILSVGLRSWVRQFEFEQNVPIERFGILTDYSKRVTTIKDSLKGYVKNANFKFASADAGQQGDGNDPNDDNGGGNPGNPRGNDARGGGSNNGGKGKGGRNGK